MDTTNVLTDPEAINVFQIVWDYLLSGNYLIAMVFYVFYYVTWYFTHMGKAERIALDDPNNINNDYNKKEVRKLFIARHDQYVAWGLILILAFHWGSEILEFLLLLWFPVLKGLRLTLIATGLDAIVAYIIMAILERDENVNSVPKKIITFVKGILNLVNKKDS